MDWKSFFLASLTFLDVPGLSFRSDGIKDGHPFLSPGPPLPPPFNSCLLCQTSTPLCRWALFASVVRLCPCTPQPPFQGHGFFGPLRLLCPCLVRPPVLAFPGRSFFWAGFFPFFPFLLIVVCFSADPPVPPPLPASSGRGSKP